MPLQMLGCPSSGLLLYSKTAPTYTSLLVAPSCVGLYVTKLGRELAVHVPASTQGQELLCHYVRLSYMVALPVPATKG